MDGFTKINESADIDWAAISAGQRKLLLIVLNKSCMKQTSDSTKRHIGHPVLFG